MTSLSASSCTCRHLKHLAYKPIKSSFIRSASHSLPLQRHFSSDSTSHNQTNNNLSPVYLRRVVVTGIGMVSPLGLGSKSVYDVMMEGASGLKAIDESNFPNIHALDLPSKVCAPLPKELHPIIDSYVPRSVAGQCSPFIRYAMAATDLALQDAGLHEKMTDEERERTGVCLGSGIGDVEEIREGGRQLDQRGRRGVGAYSIPRLLINLAAGQVSIKHGFMGPNHSVSTACATGAHAIGDASRFIALGDADMMIAGSAEMPITPLSMALFARIRALSSKFNDDPTRASRPFAKSRDGFVMGEGSGVMVLEEYEHAKMRGARIYAELVGYGTSGDAHHITTPPSDGRGAKLAMKRALHNSRLSISDIDYVNAHATSTGLGDSAENAAIKAIFGSHAYNLSVSSSKGAIGHLLGASGSVEACVAAMSCFTQSVPPTVNLRDDDIDLSEFDLDYVLNTGKTRQVRAAISNSFGFGGTNASLVFKAI